MNNIGPISASRDSLSMEVGLLELICSVRWKGDLNHICPEANSPRGSSVLQPHVLDVCFLL